jgi:glutamate--cysteine ligase
VRSIARWSQWIEVRPDEDPPSWLLPGGSRLSFEPGGQIELSSAPSDSATALIRDLRCTSELLASAFDREGILLEAVGVDPCNDISDVPLQLHRERYERMTRYFDAIGPSGAKMMRQTASLQINIQTGERPHERWRLLNSLTPYITAIFANSRLYAGLATEDHSHRAHLWRNLDPSRTGLPATTGNPAVEYMAFALGAGPMMSPQNGATPTFGEWLRTGEPTIEDWQLHLTTLFPEVRPRGYFELRSADSIAPSWIAAPICFVAGLVYDEATAAEALEVAGEPDASTLELAGRVGLADDNILSTACRLTELAVSGCESLGPEYIAESDLVTAADFFDRYTRQGRSPGDDCT